MNRLSPERTEYATTLLIRLVQIRGLNQTQLEDLSGIAQPQVSNILTRKKVATEEQLKSLFAALGILLRDVIAEADDVPENILGYFATPLTDFVKDPKKDAMLRKFVAFVKEVASSAASTKPYFRLYWPGDYTHPLKNTEYTPQQVYITDRSRASTFDFIVIFCAAPSYGVGQENEIATQGGVPAIRFVRPGLTRMMTGAFLRTQDIGYSESDNEGSEFTFDASSFVNALKEIRFLYFRRKALFRAMSDGDFGPRLQQLIDDRMIQDRSNFAAELGISMDYLSALMNEPLNITNPSATILKRMASVLGVTVGYLLGESVESDAILAASMASWHKWVTSIDGIDAKAAMGLRDYWKEEYLIKRHGELLSGSTNIGSRSNRNGDQASKVMTETDWDKCYQQRQAKIARSAAPDPQKNAKGAKGGPALF